MNPYIVAIILLLAFSLAGAAGLRNAAGRKGRTISVESIKSMSRAEITQMLERVAREKEPEFVMGAMCYSVMAPPDTAEYICPVCGEKTVYGADHASMILWDISTARSIVEGIRSSTDLDVSLDESSFCSFCSTDPVEPGLRLVVTYEDGSVNTAVTYVDELRMLSGLLSGNLYYQTSNDSQSPLKPNLDRLCALLGIEVEVPSE